MGRTAERELSWIALLVKIKTVSLSPFNFVLFEVQAASWSWCPSTYNRKRCGLFVVCLVNLMV